MAYSSSTNGSTSYQQTYSQGGSDTHSEYGSTSNTHSHSSTDSYSKSHSEGGSKSVSAGESATKSASQGGSKSVSTGESWASGKVSNRTQQKFNQATQDYVRSQKVEDAYANLQNAINARPTFQSKYEDRLTDMYNKIMNREAFTYDFNKDAMYQQYKDMYQRQGKTAMQDTMGQLSAMNNGYGSSYAQTAGQQTYQNYLQMLNDRIPELRQQALNEYDRENDRLMQQYGLTNDAYNREYAQYRDTMADWQSDRSYNQSAYQDERNFDYNKAQNDRSFWQNEYWQEKNAAHSNAQTSEGTNWNTGTSYSQNRSQTDSQNWSDTETHGHSETDTDSTTETSGWSDSHTSSWNNSATYGTSSGWSNTSSTGSGGGGSSSGVAGERVVPYNLSPSLDAYSEASRNALMYGDPDNPDDKSIATWLRNNDQDALGDYIVDALNKGVKVGNKIVTMTPQDLANQINNSDAFNNRSSGDSKGKGVGSTNYMNNVTAKDIKAIYEKYGGDYDKNKNAKYKKGVQFWG